MVTCAVPGCKSSKKENPENYTFHTFPNNIEVRNKWLKMVNRGEWVPKKYSTICSKHFEPHCFSHRGAKRVKLCSGSVPTLFMPVTLKPKRKVSTYIYRDITAVPSTVTTTTTTTANTSSTIDQEKTVRKLKKTNEELRRRIHIVLKRLKNVRAQKKRANKKIIQLSLAIHNLLNLPSIENKVSAIGDSCSNDLYM